MRRAINQAVRDKVDVFIGGETSLAMAEGMIFSGNSGQELTFNPARK